MKNVSKALVCFGFICVLVVIAFAAQTPAKIALPVPPPDLLVNLDNITPAKFGCGVQTVTFTVTETNAGTSPSGSFFLQIQVALGNGSFNPICNVSRPSLGGSSSRSFTGSCTFWNGPCDCLPTNDPGTIRFRAFIDSLLQVTESNENNNLSNILSRRTCCDVNGPACCAQDTDVKPIEEEPLPANP